MKKLGLISVLVVLALGLAASSFAVVKKKGMGTGMRHVMDSCEGPCGCDGSNMEKLKALGLDAKQMEAVRAVHLRTRKEMVRKGAEVEVAELELKEILSKDPVDLKAAEDEVKKMEGLKSDMKMLHIKAMEEIKANLNPEQKKKFIETMGPMGHRMDMRRKCNMQGMGPMHEMDYAPGDGGTPPMRHRHN